MMTLAQRISAFDKLGAFLRESISNDFKFTPHRIEIHGDADYCKKMDELQLQLIDLYEYSNHYNIWFTPKNVKLSLSSWAESLTFESLLQWTKNYDFSIQKESKNIGVVMAGNLPLVGFHDYLSVLISGNKIAAKLSGNDAKLLPLLHQILCQIEPGFEEMASFTKDQITDFDAIIATGSNNSARYFEHYFSKYPHIIRKNRNGVAIIHGDETNDELKLLGKDITSYYGLGCRNVSKLYVPENYQFDQFFRAIENFKEIGNHSRYFNNYEYNKAIYLVNSVKHLDNGFMLLKQDYDIASPIGVVYYEEYANYNHLKLQLDMRHDEIQCIVSMKENELKFGSSQNPGLMDYADGVDTMSFLINL